MATTNDTVNKVNEKNLANRRCSKCNETVFQMERICAEGLAWHKKCFRCVQCNQQLNVDNYQSHERTLYCRIHFKELFLPKPVEDTDSEKPRKPELIIRENAPKEPPPDTVRACEKPDLGLKELSGLNVKARFQVFVKSNTETNNEAKRQASPLPIRKSPSILSKVAKFQEKDTNVGVANESLYGLSQDDFRDSEEIDDSEDLDSELLKTDHIGKGSGMTCINVDDIKNRWESTCQQKHDLKREAPKDEIAGIRSRLLLGKQSRMKEMYQQAISGNDNISKTNAAEEIGCAVNARSIKERFEKGEIILPSGDDNTNKPSAEKPDEEVIAAGIGRESRLLFLKLDANAKTENSIPLSTSKSSAELSQHGPGGHRRLMSQTSETEDIVRSTDVIEDVTIATSDIAKKFNFFETYKEPERQRRQFRITPPREGQVKMDSPEYEVYRDPEIVRSDEKVNDVVCSGTAKKMLNVFRQMEKSANYSVPGEVEADQDTADFAKEGYTFDEINPKYFRSSSKVDDDFLKEAQCSARAKTLREKFEHWTSAEEKISTQSTVEEESTQSISTEYKGENTASIKARFETLGSQTCDVRRAPKVKVNRFVMSHE
ncbi:uncharacterized protein LOC105703765 [Orussus abietinus]|uniref:uncharacterized protein LOC105703765 n=1 Tax=Orussus abietinus TaxID=222816 RepID=UPI0006254CC0|nr:uncharacterized protein LOC105703765 [Orussus abietinus]XP_012287833.1 uncharacterized protein LOC105703765 [Orussus abietinus]